MMESIVRGPIVIAQITRKVLVDGQNSGEAVRLDLTPVEYEILRRIALEGKTPTRKDYLERTVLGRSFKSKSNAVNVQISRIRKKLKNARSGCEKLLVTVRKAGFILLPEPVKSAP